MGKSDSKQTRKTKAIMFNITNRNKGSEDLITIRQHNIRKGNQPKKQLSNW